MLTLPAPTTRNADLTLQRPKTVSTSCSSVVSTSEASPRRPTRSVKKSAEKTSSRSTKSETTTRRPRRSAPPCSWSTIMKGLTSPGLSCGASRLPFSSVSLEGWWTRPAMVRVHDLPGLEGEPSSYPGRRETCAVAWWKVWPLGWEWWYLRSPGGI